MECRECCRVEFTIGANAFCLRFIVGKHMVVEERPRAVAIDRVWLAEWRALRYCAERHSTRAVSLKSFPSTGPSA